MKYRFRRWLRDWLTNFDGDQLVSEKSRTPSIRESDYPDNEKSLNFRVWFANGGRVIQTSRYDRIKDRTLTSMYVITEYQDFGEEINKIITVEGLRG